MTRRGLQVAAGIALGTGLSAVVLLVGGLGTDGWSDDPHALPGSFAPPSIQLTDLSGLRTTLPDDFAAPTVVFFGYTNCPDVCPPTLSKLAAASDSLRAVGERPPTVVFVTVDPTRDTPGRMREYLDGFDPAFRGLTGRPQEVLDAARGWGVYAAQAGAGNSEPASADHGAHDPPPGQAAARVDSAGGGYLVDHTARSFVLGRTGEVVATFPVDAPVAGMIRTLRLVEATGR